MTKSATPKQSCNLSPKKLAMFELKDQAKSIYDAAIGMTATTLQAMAHWACRVVHKVNESNSTRRFSNCQSLTEPFPIELYFVALLSYFWSE
jgi:hypothetical protein